MRTGGFGFLIGALISFQSLCYGTELSYNRSTSSSTTSQKFKLGQNLAEDHKVSLGYTQSQDQTGAEDPDSSNLKLTYRLRTENKNSFSFDFKSSNESYFFEGFGFAFKPSFAINEDLRLNLAIGFDEKTYTKISNEKINQRSLSVGVDDTISETITIGADLSFNNTTGTGTLVKRALNEENVTTTDISNYISNLSSRTFSTYIDYSKNDFLVGLSLASDTSLIGSGRQTTTDFYVDWTPHEQWTLSAALSRGRSESSSSITSTTSLGLMYSF